MVGDSKFLVGRYPTRPKIAETAVPSESRILFFKSVQKRVFSAHRGVELGGKHPKTSVPGFFGSGILFLVFWSVPGPGIRDFMNLGCFTKIADRAPRGQETIFFHENCWEYYFRNLHLLVPLVWYSGTGIGCFGEFRLFSKIAEFRCQSIIPMVPRDAESQK